MSQAIIGTWGKSLAIRLPADVAEAAGLGDGERVEIFIERQVVVIRKAAQSFTVDDLFHGKSAEEWRQLYTDVYEWGADLGREVVDA